MSDSSLTTTQLRLEFYKSLLTFGLATLGGEITLLHSLFKDAPLRVIAYVSILMMTFSSILLMSAKEVLITRIDPFPTRNRVDRLMDIAEIGHPTAERLLRAASGLLYGVGLLLFVLFIVLVPFVQT